MVELYAVELHALVRAAFPAHLRSGKSQTKQQSVQSRNAKRARSQSLGRVGWMTRQSVVGSGWVGDTHVGTEERRRTINQNTKNRELFSEGLAVCQHDGYLY